MDQGVVAPYEVQSNARFVRLLLIFFGAVFGLLVLSMFFGSSSASADDGGDSGDGIGAGADLGGIAATVTDPVEQAVAAVIAAPAATITSPITGAVDTTLTAVGGSSPLGSTPLTSILEPVVGLVDTTLTDVTDAVAPAIGTLDMTGMLMLDTAVAAAPASMTAAVVAAIGGVADGTLDLGAFAVPTDEPGTSGVASAGNAMLATALGAGLLALLLARRQPFSQSEMPGSPVYATDSSPD